MASYSSPCAACKFLRRKCTTDCVFEPYFPPEEPQKFANVHKIFGASNVAKLLNELLPQQREDAVNSLAYEAEARVRDPVYGCVGAISFLQRQVDKLQKELDAANADLVRFSCNEMITTTMVAPPQGGGGGGGGSLVHPIAPSCYRQIEVNTRVGNENGVFYQTPNFTFPYPTFQWHNNNYNHNNSSGDYGGGSRTF